MKTVSLVLCLAFVCSSCVGQVVSRDWIASAAVKSKAGVATHQIVPISRGGADNGSLIVAGIAVLNGSVLAVSDTAGNSYSIDVQSTFGGGCSCCTARTLATNPLPIGGSIIITLSGGTAFSALAYAFDGLMIGLPQESAFAVGLGVSANSSSVAGTGSLRIGVVAARTSIDDTFIPSQSLTDTVRLGTSGGSPSSNVWVSIGYRIVNATGTFFTGGTLQRSSYWSASALSYN